MTPDFAWTGNGTSCSQCGEPVHYDEAENLHVHDQPAPDCYATRHIAAGRKAITDRRVRRRTRR